MWKLGSLGSPKVIENSAIRYSAYESLLAFQSNYVPILHHFWDVARYWSKITDLNILYLCLAPEMGVISWEFRRDLWHQKTRVIGGIVWRYLCDHRFSRFRRTPTCDRRTDWQTDTRWQHRPR